LLDRLELGRMEATRRAAEFAYREAGIGEIRAVEGLVAELDDSFNSLLPINLVDLGLFDPDEAIDALVGLGRGDADPSDPYTNPLTGPYGKIPVNLSGGLKARGHPVGGTGLFQIAEVFLQLTGRFPNPRAQVPNARLGISQSMGGPGNNNFVTILELTQNRREVARLPEPPRYLRPPGEPLVPASTLHGKRARIEAATTIHVTATDDEPIHVALLSVGDRRVFAKLDAPAEAGLDLTGQRARFLIKDDGDHYFQLVRDRWDMQSLFRSIRDRVLLR
jgi:hypothetical protein